MINRQRTRLHWHQRTRLPTLLLLSCFSAGCAISTYQSPAPSRAEVRDVRAQIDAVRPQRVNLSVAEATAIAEPIFDAMATDAVRICRTVARADSCQAPEFAVESSDQVNARAGFDTQGNPTISLTRALIEHFSEQPGALALVIGHEYGHLIVAHVKQPKANDSLAADVLTSAMSVLSATSAVTAGNGRDHRNAGGATYSQRDIDEYLEATSDPEGAYVWFSRAEELEADYIGTYLATRSGFSPTGSALVQLGGLRRLDELSPWEKQVRKVSFAYWDTHTYSPDRAARIHETLEEIARLKTKGYTRPIPPTLILDLTNNNSAIHSLEELVAPEPSSPSAP